MKPEDLDMQDGKVIVKDDPSKGVPLAQAVRGNLFATYSGRPPNALWTQRGRALDTMNVATCEVAVDTETGEVEILRFGVVADTGKIMRRTSLEGQIHQVMDFTKGCQLQEEFIFDQKTGVRLSTNMFEYKKVSMLDMPRVDLQFWKRAWATHAMAATASATLWRTRISSSWRSTTRSASGLNRRLRRIKFSKRWERHRRR